MLLDVTDVPGRDIFERTRFILGALADVRNSPVKQQHQTEAVHSSFNPPSQLLLPALYTHTCVCRSDIMYNFARARPLARAVRAAAVRPRAYSAKLRKPLTQGAPHWGVLC
jgi:hypothetical protein